MAPSRSLRTLLGSLAAVLMISSSTPAQQVRDPLHPDAPPKEAAETGRKPAGADLSEAGARIRDQDYEGAVALLEPQLERFPDDRALLLMLGEVRLALHRPEQALEALSHGAGIEPVLPRMHFQTGAALVALGRQEEALTAFQAEIDNNEDPSIVVLSLLNRAFVLQNLKRWEEAAGELLRVAELDPDRTAVFGDAASLYIQARNPVEAEKVLAAGADRGFRSAEHYYSLGAAFYKKKMYDRAVAAYLLCLEQKPTHANAERGIGLSLEKAGKEAEAVAHFRKYLELKPDARDRDKILEAIGTD